MKSWRDKLLLIVLLIGCGFIFVFSISFVIAESGWDNDYDSSYDSGSNWDSGSSWDRGYNYSSDKDYSNDNYTSSSSSNGGRRLSFREQMFFLGLLLFILVPSLLKVLPILVRDIKRDRKIRKRNKIMQKRIKEFDKKYGSYDNNNFFKDLDIEKINNIDSNINKEEIKKLCFDLYNNIQIAWMNFDYDSLKKYTTDELFNMYKSQLEILSAKKEKNIMSDIEYKDAKIIDIKIENGIEEVRMYLNTITKDYVIDKDNNIIRGSDKFRNNMEYIITLVRNIGEDDIRVCPSCRVPIDMVSGGKCPYCGSVIVYKNTEFVMSKKECIGQERV